MKRFVLIAVLITGLTAGAATAKSRVASSPSAARCGGSLWRMKTLSDSQRSLVRLTPATTTIGAIAKRPFPRPVPIRRRTPFQRQVWSVVSQITQYRLESGGVRLVLFDAGSYMNAVIPLPNCLSSSTRARGQISQAWKAFTGCAQPAAEWQSLGAVAYVGGVGFWAARGQGRGSAPNGAELHPVTSIRIVAGCSRRGAVLVWRLRGG
jgi:hypothetical protein